MSSGCSFFTISPFLILYPSGRDVRQLCIIGPELRSGNLTGCYLKTVKNSWIVKSRTRRVECLVISFAYKIVWSWLKTSYYLLQVSYRKKTQLIYRNVINKWLFDGN